MKYRNAWDQKTTPADKVLAYLEYAHRPAELKEIVLDLIPPGEINNLEAKNRWLQVITQTVMELAAEGKVVEERYEYNDGSTGPVYVIAGKAESKTQETQQYVMA